MYAFKPFSFDKAVQAATTQMELASRTFEPWLKAGTRSNLELLALATRRGRAAMDLASRLAACRTPQDAIREQGAFWQGAAQDWLESSNRIMSAWLAASPKSFAAAWRSPAEGDGSAERRTEDSMIFAERDEASAPARTPGKRRAAA